jgi:hypothetical protein
MLRVETAKLYEEHGYVFFYLCPQHEVSLDPDNRDVEQLSLIRLCGHCSVWHIPIIGIAPMNLLEGMSKKRHTHAPSQALRPNFSNGAKHCMNLIPKVVKIARKRLFTSLSQSGDCVLIFLHNKPNKSNKHYKHTCL